MRQAYCLIACSNVGYNQLMSADEPPIEIPEFLARQSECLLPRPQTNPLKSVAAGAGVALALLAPLMGPVKPSVLPQTPQVIRPDDREGPDGTEPPKRPPDVGDSDLDIPPFLRRQLSK